MKQLYLLIAMVFASLAAHTQSFTWHSTDLGQFTLHTTATENINFQPYGQLAAATIQSFFGNAFRQTFSVFIYPSREALDRQWRAAWALPDFNSECWMVGSGVYNRFDFLSPRVWSTEACEHNGNDTVEIQQIVTHEFVHVYHGQHNPKPTFDGLDSIDWFIEGIATLVAGQLSESKVTRMKTEFTKGNVPTALSQIWRGTSKYAKAGSLVAYIDKTFGRATTLQLLKATSQNEVLSILNLTERELIDRWLRSLNP